MLKNKNINYFKVFSEMVDYSCKISEILHTSLQTFNIETINEKLEKMHEIEHLADDAQHNMMSRLLREFIPPIEREDIIELAREIDEITDSIEDVLIRIYMFNIKEIRPEALEFTSVITACCKALSVAMEDFENFKKSKIIHSNIIEINRLEEEGDALYTKSMRNLYLNEKDPILVTSWTATFDRLEKCCDTCEHVANIMETIVMKNS